MGANCSTTKKTNPLPASASHQTSASIIKDLQVPIYFVNFKSLLARNEFPRYPEDKELAVSVAEIDTSKSLLVFISHCWARGGFDYRCKIYRQVTYL